MLKKLRVRFVCIMMTIVTVLLCVIMGLVVHYTAEALEKQSLELMDTIANNPFYISDLEEEYTASDLPFYLIQIRRGTLYATGGNQYDLSDRSFVVKVTNAVLSREEDTGVLEAYGLRYKKTTSMQGQTIVLADLSMEKATISDLIRDCVRIGILGLAAFLAVSLHLARWAVRPVEKAWQQQRQFVADASHELKTPLTVIMTNAELMQDEAYTPEDRQRFSAHILTMSQQMRGLVEGLLELARVDNGAVKTAFAELSLSELVRDGILPFEPLYFERGLQLSNRIQDGLKVRGSAAHLRQVQDILLDNALKYADPAGTVWVQLRQHGNHSLLSVSSPGPAISQEDLQNIFKRFYRIDKARGRDGSYGLGLSIAQSIVTEHRGKIWAESANGWNTFYVQLPLTL